MKRTLFGVVGVTAFIFAGCGGGGGGGATTSAVPAQTVATAAALPQTTGTATAQFTINIPVATSTSALRRSPKYVSPNTGSASFAVSGGATTVVTLTPGSASCPLSGGFYTCTAQARIPAGVNQLITISTFASSDGTGTPLSTNTISQTITPGIVNNLSVQLNGVLNSLTLAIAGAFTVGVMNNIMVTATPKDPSGATIIGPGSLVDASGNPITPTLTTSDTTGATSVSGNISTGFVLHYSGAAIKSPTLALAATGLTTQTQLVRVDSAVVNGDFTVAATGSNSLGAPWYTCGVQHIGLAAAINPSPSPVPSPITQTLATSSPSPLPVSPATPVAQLQSSVPSGAVGTVSGGYTQYAMVNSAVAPKSYARSVGICQDITVPAGSPTLNLQLLEGGDDNFANTDTEATLFTTPTVVSTPHPDGTLINTAPIATLFAENNCWDSAGWEPIFLGSGYGGTGTGSAISSTARFAACPETPGGTPPYPAGLTGQGGFWYTKSLNMSAYAGNSYTLFLGVWRSAASGTPALASNAYYSYAYFTGVNLH